VLAVGVPDAITAYDLSNLQPLQFIHTDQNFSLLAVSLDGLRLADADLGGDLQVWASATGKAVRYMRVEVVNGPAIPEIGMYTISQVFGPQHWLGLGAAGTAYFLVADTGHVADVFGDVQSHGLAVALSPDGQKVGLSNETQGSSPSGIRPTASACANSARRLTAG
jgi:hypothetical protein